MMIKKQLAVALDTRMPKRTPRELSPSRHLKRELKTATQKNYRTDIHFINNDILYMLSNFKDLDQKGAQAECITSCALKRRDPKNNRTDYFYMILKKMSKKDALQEMAIGDILESVESELVLHPIKYFNIKDSHFVLYRRLDYDLLDGDRNTQRLRDQLEATHSPYHFETAALAFIKIFEYLIKAIKTIHHKGIVHLDIKPENIMVTNLDGEFNLKLIDFGLSGLIGETKQALTGTGIYQAPESIKSMLDVNPITYTVANDYYQLGETLWIMLTGTMFYNTELDTIGKALSIMEIQEKNIPNYETIEKLRDELMDIDSVGINKTNYKRYYGLTNTIKLNLFYIMRSEIPSKTLQGFLLQLVLRYLLNPKPEVRSLTKFSLALTTLKKHISENLLPSHLGVGFKWGEPDVANHLKDIYLPTLRP